MSGSLMFIIVGGWISPVALGAVALGVTLGLRAPWWAVLLVVAACGALALAAVRLLMRWSDAHAVRVWDRRPAQLHAREVPAVFPAAGPPAAIGQHVRRPPVIQGAITEGERRAR